MYEFAYNEIVDESAQAMRAQEARALDRVIAHAARGRAHGPEVAPGHQRALSVETLWTVFLDDLNGSENALPATLRARLISIGIWVNKEIERLRGGESRDLGAAHRDQSDHSRRIELRRR